MFYIQTQEQPLPYIYKIYKTPKGARKAVVRFLSQNPEDGAIAICDAFHSTKNYFYREDGAVTEEITDAETGDVMNTVYHGTLNDFE